jgi:transposase
MIDGSNVRAHQHAAGAIGGQEYQALGRSKGGFSTKIHAKVDAFGMPLKLIFTGGQAHETNSAIQLMGNVPCDYLLADRAYDSNKFREFLRQRGTIPVIPSKKNRIQPIAHDKHIYKERNFVERFFNRIKHFRRVATRYDKLAVTFAATVTVACIILWLKF